VVYDQGSMKKQEYLGVAYTVTGRGPKMWHWAIFPRSVSPASAATGVILGARGQADDAAFQAIEAWLRKHPKDAPSRA
jgi:hypothetical protein